MIYILRLAKAEQLGLFDSIVHVAPHVRKDGTYVGQHERHQKVRQRDLFADHPAPEKPKPKASSKARRLISYVAGKGGPERMGAMLRAQPAAVTDRLVLGFTAETGLPEFEVRSILGLGGDQKAEKQPEPAPDQEPVKSEAPTSTSIPQQVRSRVEIALRGLRETHDRLSGVKRARGNGYILASELSDAQPEIAKKRKVLDDFRELAKRNGVDAAGVIDGLGGEPDFSMFEASGETVPADHELIKKPEPAASRTWRDLYDDLRSRAQELAGRAMDAGDGKLSGRISGSSMNMTEQNAPYLNQQWIGEVIKGFERHVRAAEKRAGLASAPVAPNPSKGVHEVKQEAPEGAADTGPKEGDTKTVAGIDYRLQDGRWHRVRPEEAGQAESTAADPSIVEHVTKKGKTLRGIVRTDLTKEQALEIDAYTFRKDGGWFIREKHLETASALDSAHAGGALTPEQHQSAKAANAEGGPAAAKESLKLKVLADKAAKLRQTGQKLADDAAADRNRDRNTNTARRARMAASAEADAAYRESVGKTMMKLADALEAGEVPNLVGVTTRAAIEQLDMAMRSAMQRRESGLSYAESQSQKGRPFDDVDLRHVQMPRAQWRDGDKSALISKIAGKRDAVSLRAEILREPDLTQAIYDKAKAMIGEKELLNTVGWYAPEQLKKVARLERAGITDNEKLREAINQFRQVKAGKVEADPVKLAERAIIGQKVGIDFFPTPKPLAERMARLAAVQPGDKVLEPSAGNGNLADAAKAAGGDVDTVEVSDALRNILQAKGHNLAGRNFDTYEPGAQYDAVIMNPPFSNRQDAAHIMRAWGMVKPGGKLVAIAGEGVFFGSDQKAQAFRDWLDDNAADVEKLPEGTFTDKSLLATTSANARLVVIHKPGGPQEGDRKTENGVEYVLQDGRWRRAVEPVPEIEAVPEAEPAPVASAAEIAEDREDLADEMMRDPHGEKARELVQKIAEKEAAAKQADEPVTVAPAVDGVEHAIPAKPKAARRPRAKDVPDDLDPTSPNYRYRDTGYVAGSRKEAVTEQFRRAVKAGQLMRQATIDWEEVESNPREAKELITKSNLFGAVDWAALREGGMDPAAGFLIDRVYASIAPEPTSDGPMGRKDYVLGLESIRDRLERCKTPNEVTAVLGEMRDEWEGVMLNASDADDYKAASAEASAIWEKVRAVKDEQDRQQRAWSDQRVALSILEREQESRARRKWKADPELDAKVAAQQIVTGAAHEAYMAWVAENTELEGKKRDHGNGWTSNDSDLEWEYREARQRADAIMSAAKARNLIENPTTRAWATLGPRFHAVMNYRRFKGGSKAFAEHVAAAKTGAVKDWSWAEKDGAQAAPRASKKAESFHLRVAESFERQGGRPVSVESTQALKDTYGLRDVQSGNWVLNDPTSASFHVQRSAEAFADLADLLGVEDSKVSMNGRLAMAFGARGKGNAGWKGAASATYEPVHRVINLTKMGGGGALAHEWWHAIDNLAKEAEGGGESGKDDFASENPSILPAGELRDAFNELHRAMTEGTHRAGRAFAYTERDYKLAKANVDHYRPNDVAKRIKGAADAESAVQAVEDYYRPLLARSSDKRMQKQQEQWTTLAVAYHDGNPAGAKAVVRAGRPMSSFALEALKLDEGQMYRNWSSRSEMSARAFQSWIEDRLAEKGRRNDYLSVYADNKYHVDPLLGPQYPYPDGDERKRINAAFDRLVEVLRMRDTLSKSLKIISKK